MPEERVKSLPCLKCGKELYEVFPLDLHNGFIQPNHGLHFSTPGHYGSRVYDPMVSGEEMVICICDECIVANKNKIKIQETRYIPPDIKYREWEYES